VLPCRLMPHLANDPPLKQAIQDITRYVAALKAERRLPGCSVAVVHGDDLVWAEGFGLADHSRGIPTSPRTVYKAASLTKLFTATLMMILRDEGLLSLDEPLSKYVVGVRVQNPFPDPQPLTFRQVAAHVAGLPVDPPPDHKAAHPDASGRDLLQWLRDVELLAPPLTRYGYSNVGYAVLGYVLSIIGAAPFRRLIKQRILEPLAMESTTFDHQKVPAERMAVGYRPPTADMPIFLPNGRCPLLTVVHGDPGLMAPAGGLYSTVLDLARFVSWQFHQGPRIPDRPLGSLSLREMHTPVLVEPDWSGGTGLGWRVGPLGPFTWVGHMGGLPGYSSEIMAVPSLKLGVVALTNMDATVGGICWNTLQRLVPLYADRLSADADG